MTQRARTRVLFPVCAALLAALLLAVSASAVPHLQKTSAPLVGEERASARGGPDFAYEIVPLSFSTQMTDSLFQAPYFYFYLTNTGNLADTYHLTVTEIDDPMNWFGQVCIDAICYPDSVDWPLNPVESDSLLVNAVPFTDGVDTFTFTISSIGNPSLVDAFELTLYAGTAAVDVRPLGTFDVSDYELRQNTPNPVRTTTVIDFALPRKEAVDLRIYDVTGRVVRTLSQGIRSEGPHRLAWNGTDDSGRNVPAGVYFYRLATPEKVLARRLTLIR